MLSAEEAKSHGGHNYAAEAHSCFVCVSHMVADTILIFKLTSSVEYFLLANSNPLCGCALLLSLLYSLLL